MIQLINIVRETSLSMAMTFKPLSDIRLANLPNSKIIIQYIKYKHEPLLYIINVMKWAKQGEVFYVKNCSLAKGK